MAALKLLLALSFNFDKITQYFERVWPIIELIKDLIIAFFSNLQALFYAGTLEQLLSALMGLLPFILIFLGIVALLRVAKYIIYFFSAILIGTIIIKLVQLILFV